MVPLAVLFPVDRSAVFEKTRFALDLVFFSSHVLVAVKRKMKSLLLDDLSSTLPAIARFIPMQRKLSASSNAMLLVILFFSLL